MTQGPRERVAAAFLSSGLLADTSHQQFVALELAEIALRTLDDDAA